MGTDARAVTYTAPAPARWLAALRHAPLFVLFVYFLVAPFYVLPSAMPQPADLAILALGVLVGIGTGFIPAFRHFFSSYALLYFVSYVAAVSAYWAILEQRLALGKGTILINPLFYAFNLVVFVAVVTLYVRFRATMLRAVTLAASTTLLVQFALALLHPATGSIRQEIFFNNPNQLGFFALLSVTIFAIGAKWLRLPFWYQVVTYGAAVYLTLVSLSKAAIIATAILIVITLIRRPGSVIVSGLVIVTLVFLTDFGAALVRSTEERLDTVGRTKDDSLEARGYHRIVDFPEYLAFGSAEGAYDRFDPAHPIEIHSSPGTILFSYGLVGSAAFLFFLLHVVKRAPVYLVAHLLPVAFYSVTHNGLRDSLFWILLAFLQCLAVELGVLRRQHLASVRARRPGLDLAPRESGQGSRPAGAARPWPSVAGASREPGA
jgi:hypothetical protein